MSKKRLPREVTRATVKINSELGIHVPILFFLIFYLINFMIHCSCCSMTSLSVVILFIALGLAIGAVTLGIQQTNANFSTSEVMTQTMIDEFCVKYGCVFVVEY